MHATLSKSGSYTKHYTCISVDPRGAGETDKPPGTYSMELFADDVAALMQAIGVERAHVSGLSLGAATGLWLAGKYPERVKSLSLHSCWPKTDPFLKVEVEGWRSMAKGLGSVHGDVDPGHLPRCASRRNSMRPNRTISISSRLSCAVGRSSPLMPSSASRAR